MRILAHATLFLLVTSLSAAAVASGCRGSVETHATGTTTQSAGGGSSTQSAGGGSSTQSAGGGSSTQSTGAAGAAGAGSTTSAGAGGGPPVLSLALCTGHVYACGDTIDNDNDGLIDSQDPECTGPCDGTEDSFFLGLPDGGSFGPACVQDCHWDNDLGSGNDECHWSHQCDEHEVAPNYYPESYVGATCEYDPNANIPGTIESCDSLIMTQSQACHDFCDPLTPNGCDCFGCCEVPGNPGNYVWLGSMDAVGNGKCTLANLTNPDFCEPCKPVQACLNPCDCSEICIGKPLPDCLDPDSGPNQCPGGQQPCGLPGQPFCPSGYYCITGCCQPVPL